MLGRLGHGMSGQLMLGRSGHGMLGSEMLGQSMSGTSGASNSTIHAMTVAMISVMTGASRSITMAHPLLPSPPSSGYTTRFQGDASIAS